MKYTHQPRLKIYHNILGKFDLIDKNNNFQSKFFKSISIKVSWYFNECNKIDLNKLLFKEFYLQQRFKYKETSNRIENTFFIITLRKAYVFLYLEMLLNSYFLQTNVKFKKDVNFIFNVSRQNKFFIDVSTSKDQFSKFKLKNIFKFNPTLNTEQILVNFNYYFLPIAYNNLGE